SSCDYRCSGSNFIDKPGTQPGAVGCRRPYQSRYLARASLERTYRSKLLVSHFQQTGRIDPARVGALCDQPARYLVELLPLGQLTRNSRSKRPCGRTTYGGLRKAHSSEAVAASALG